MATAVPRHSWKNFRICPSASAQTGFSFQNAIFDVVLAKPPPSRDSRRPRADYRNVVFARHSNATADRYGEPCKRTSGSMRPKLSPRSLAASLSTLMPPRNQTITESYNNNSDWPHYRLFHSISARTYAVPDPLWQTYERLSRHLTTNVCPGTYLRRTSVPAPAFAIRRVVAGRMSGDACLCGCWMPQVFFPFGCRYVGRAAAANPCSRSVRP